MMNELVELQRLVFEAKLARFPIEKAKKAEAAVDAAAVLLELIVMKVSRLSFLIEDSENGNAKRGA